MIKSDGAEIGQRYGSRTIASSPYRRNKCYYVDTKCDCGEMRGVPLYLLKAGKSTKCKSCDNKIATNFTHRKTGTRLHRIWLSMKNRCYNPSRHNYKWYGKRGVKMCDEWKSDFMAFYNWAVENGYKDTLTIDRVDGNKGYCPTNCRWVTIAEQQKNKVSNRVIAYEGRTMILEDWKRGTGLSRIAVLNRINKNESLLKLFKNGQ